MLKHAHTRTGFGRDGSAPAAGRAAVRAWRIARGGGEDVRRHPGQCPPLVPRVEGARTGGPQRSGPCGTQAAIGCGATRDPRAGAPHWPPRARVQHRPVDAAARGRRHQAPDGGATPSRPRLAGTARARVVAAAAHATSARTRREGDRGMEEAALGAAKKTPDAGTPGSSSRTKAGSRSTRLSVGRGRREAKRRS